MEQFREEDPALSARPEKRERPMIGSIVIPADESKPLRQHGLPASGLEERQALVGGNIEGVSLSEPDARMFVNEDGKYMGLPINRRATLLAWMHNERMRFGDVLVGDAVLLGYPDEDGVDTSVPGELSERLFTVNRFRAEFRRRDSDENWSVLRLRFDNWVDAYDRALSMWHARSNTIADVRVISELEDEA